MKFDAGKAIGYANEITFPRQVDSAGETEAVKLISGWLSNLGYQVSLEKFQFVNALDNVLRIEILLGQIIVAVSLLLQQTQPEAAAVSAFLIVILLVISPSIHRTVLQHSLIDESAGISNLRQKVIRRLGTKYESINILAERSCPDDRTTGTRLDLMAHYDTKSQPISLATRILLYLVVIVGAISFTLLSVLGLVIADTTIITPLLGVLVIMAGVPLLFLKSGNKSPGGLDNASGVGVMVHLAELLAVDEKFQPGVNIKFVLTGAEEYSLMGARAYLSGLVKTGEIKKYYLVNFDGIGGGDTLNVSGKSRGNNQGGDAPVAAMITACCAEISLPVWLLNFPVLLMDHIPFTDAGLNAVSIMHLGRPVLAVHTPNDKAGRLSANAVKDAGDVVLCLIQKLSDEVKASAGVNY